MKITNSAALSEEKLTDISRLISHYNDIGVYTPKLIHTAGDKYLVEFRSGASIYFCYMEEKAKYSFCDIDLEKSYLFRRQVVRHLGLLATKYTNRWLSKSRSMWSIIELSEFDVDIDEKQQNFNDLICSLSKHGYVELVKNLVDMNNKSRNMIEDNLTELPCCVYQGDLNNSNILVDDKQEFKGIIDFNMFGTEVNINCFLNESMYYISEKDFDRLSGTDVFNRCLEVQKSLMNEILHSYKLNDLERTMIEEYNNVIFSSFYPNVQLFIRLLDKSVHVEKVLEFLKMLC